MIHLVAALALGALPPLDCPPGTARRGGAPPEELSEWCEGKDPAGRPRREGPAREYYDDGGVRIEESFAEGWRDGPFVERHRNGRKAREGAFDRGERTGPWKVWFESGTVEEESEWREGVRHGHFAAFWPNGKVRTLGRHCGGAQCGTWKSFDEEGREIGSVEYGEHRLSP